MWEWRHLLGTIVCLGATTSLSTCERVRITRGIRGRLDLVTVRILPRFGSIQRCVSNCIVANLKNKIWCDHAKMLGHSTTRITKNAPLTWWQFEDWIRIAMNMIRRDRLMSMGVCPVLISPETSPWDTMQSFLHTSSYDFAFSVLRCQRCERRSDQKLDERAITKLILLVVPVCTYQWESILTVNMIFYDP